ncbi:MAG: hypothetical protein QGF07_04730 [Phycisphaerales bacterium]|nr:hypothetical protein [Phycisphaerales bacterium]
MARKLIVVIFVFTLAALELLAVRQAQINTVNEMTKLNQLISKHETTLDTLRLAIEEQCSSESLGIITTEIASAQLASDE